MRLVSLIAFKYSIVPLLFLVGLAGCAATQRTASSRPPSSAPAAASDDTELAVISDCSERLQAYNAYLEELMPRIEERGIRVSERAKACGNIQDVATRCGFLIKVSHPEWFYEAGRLAAILGCDFI